MGTTPAQQAIVDRLVEAAASYFPGLTPQDVYGRGRAGPVSACRAAVAYTLRKSGWTFEAIGDAMGRNHSTIYHIVMQYERGCYAESAPGPLPSVVAPPRDIRSLVDRVMELELTVRNLTERLEALEANAVTRRIGRAS